MADQDAEVTVDDSDSENSDLNEECLQKLRDAVGLGYEKDRNGRRGGITSAALPDRFIDSK